MQGFLCFFMKNKTGSHYIYFKMYAYILEYIHRYRIQKYKKLYSEK
jgi:hypothetical protein